MGKQKERSPFNPLEGSQADTPLSSSPSPRFLQENEHIMQGQSEVGTLMSRRHSLVHTEKNRPLGPQGYPSFEPEIPTVEDNPRQRSNQQSDIGTPSRGSHVVNQIDEQENLQPEDIMVQTNSIQSGRVEARVKLLRKGDYLFYFIIQRVILHGASKSLRH